MKKLFSVSLGIVAGLLVCLAVGQAFKSGSSTLSSASFTKRSSLESGAGNFGSGMFRSGMNAGMLSGMRNGSGGFSGGPGGSGNFMPGSGAMMGSGRMRNGTGGNVSSAEQLLDQHLSQ